MIANNVSPDFKKNTSFKRVAAKKDEGNAVWLARVIAENNYGNDGESAVILLGGNSVADFRIRVSQSTLRHDLSPSYWSAVGILAPQGKFFTVPLKPMSELSEVPRINGIEELEITDFDDPEHYPNIAIIKFTDEIERQQKYADLLRLQRSSVVDLVALMVKWLGYVWGVGKSENPLQNGEGIPSAVFTETVYGMCGIELTPGLESTASCPESIWQAAKWWRTYYEETGEIITSMARPIVPTGAFIIRQPAAAVYQKPFRPARRSDTGETESIKNETE